MSSPEELDARVTALETTVGELSRQLQRTREDAAAARVLAGGADRDVEVLRGELRDFRQATTAGFNAMREDLSDLRQDLTNLSDRLGDLEGKSDRGFAEMRGRLDATAAGQQQIVELLTTLIDRDDRP